jgi:hypothetical protein
MIARTSTIEPTEGFVRACFVDKYESLRLNGCDVLEEGFALGKDRFSFAFGGSKRFFCVRYDV